MRLFFALAILIVTRVVSWFSRFVQSQSFNSRKAHINLTRSCTALLGGYKGQDQKLIPTCMKSLQYIFKLIVKSALLHYDSSVAGVGGIEDFRGKLRELFQVRRRP